MTTNRIIAVVSLTGGTVPVLAALAKIELSGFFIFLAILASLAGLGLLFYAALRERTTNDKSRTISRGEAVVIFCSVGLWVAFCFYRALTRW